MIKFIKTTLIIYIILFGVLINASDKINLDLSKKYFIMANMYKVKKDYVNSIINYKKVSYFDTLGNRAH